MEQSKKFPREIRNYVNPKEPGGNWQNDIGKHAKPEDVYEGFDKILKENNINLSKNLKVLEVGSGNGAFVKFLQNKGINMIGTDIQPRGSNNSTQVIARIEQLPFQDEQFDVVLSNQIFDSRHYYGQYQILMMKEIARVLKHNGLYLGRESHEMKKFIIKGFNLVEKNYEPIVSVKPTIYKKS